MKKSYRIDKEILPVFKKKLLNWLQQYQVCSYYDNNQYPHYPHSRYELLAAAGIKEEVSCQYGNAFGQLKTLLDKKSQWYFGFFGYDLKNETESLYTSHDDKLGFPDLYFFVPQHVLYINAASSELIIESAIADDLYKEIISCPSITDTAFPSKYCYSNAVCESADPLLIHSNFSKADYVATIEKIKEHIANGDFYEINICIEFYAEQAHIEPYIVFSRLNDINQAPFSAFFRLNNLYVLCTSPERFLMKHGQHIIAQPMKGTITKGATPEENRQSMQRLYESEKERAENVMIVDLVRNDLARSCKPGTVTVETLFGVYPFKHVNQMVSVIRGEMRASIHPLQLIRHAFPMGSMTGAPKIIAMQHIDKYERSRRGLYAGAIGYFAPNQDFDFNVVIRSILYNQEKQYVSFHAGSAITYDADPEQEYEECLIKAKAMHDALIIKT